MALKNAAWTCLNLPRITAACGGVKASDETLKEVIM